MKAPSLQLLGGVQWFDSTFNHIAYRVAFRTPSYLLELVVIPWCLHKACISSCLHVKINPYYGIRRQFLADVACASVLAMRKKSEFPIASLTDAIFSACFSAVMTYKWGSLREIAFLHVSMFLSFERENRSSNSSRAIFCTRLLCICPEMTMIWILISMLNIKKEERACAWAPRERDIILLHFFGHA